MTCFGNKQESPRLASPSFRKEKPNKVPKNTNKGPVVQDPIKLTPDYWKI